MATPPAALTSELPQTISGVLTAFKKELQCSICLGRFRDPHSTPCHHQFCRECIIHSLQLKQKCPLCVETVTPRSLRANESLARLVASLVGLIEAYENDIGSSLSQLPVDHGRDYLCQPMANLSQAFPAPQKGSQRALADQDDAGGASASADADAPVPLPPPPPPPEPPRGRGRRGRASSASPAPSSAPLRGRGRRGAAHSSSSSSGAPPTSSPNDTPRGRRAATNSSSSSSSKRRRTATSPPPAQAAHAEPPTAPADASSRLVLAAGEVLGVSSSQPDASQDMFGSTRAPAAAAAAPAAPVPPTSVTPSAWSSAAIGGLTAPTPERHPPLSPDGLTDAQLLDLLAQVEAMEAIAPEDVPYYRSLLAYCRAEEERLRAPAVAEAPAEFVLLSTGLDAASTSSSAVTHVICPVDAQRRTKRTLKYFAAILRGAWIVSVDWVHTCLQAGAWVPETAYEVVGDDSCAKEGQGLLTRVIVVLHGTFTSPTKEQLRQLVELGGGTISDRSTSSARDDERIVHICASVDVRRRLAARAIVAVPPSWLLDSISAFELLPIDAYCNDQGEAEAVMDGGSSSDGERTRKRKASSQLRGRASAPSSSSLWGGGDGEGDEQARSPPPAGPIPDMDTLDMALPDHRADSSPPPHSPSTPLL